MRLFTCQACKHTVYFENVRCLKCGHTLAYLPDARRISALEVSKDDPSLYVALSEKASAKRYRLCANSIDHGVCNWAIPEDDDNPFRRSVTRVDASLEGAEVSLPRSLQRLDMARPFVPFSIVLSDRREIRTP